MLVDTLHNKFPLLPDLRVRDIQVDKNLRRVYCVISYPDVSSLDGNLRGDLRAAVSESMPRGYRCEVQFANDKFNANSFITLIVDFTKKRFPLFADVKHGISATVHGLEASACFSVNKFTGHNMKLAGYIDALTEFFSAYSCYSTRFEIVEDKSSDITDVDISNQERLVQLAVSKELLKPKRYFTVKDVEKQIGKDISSYPMYISDIRGPMDSCVICGKISEKQLRDVKNNSILKLCKFNLTDSSGATMPCLMFVRFEIENEETIRQTTGKSDSEVHTISRKQRLANDKRMKKLAFLFDGQEVLVRGKVVFSQYSQRLELQMYDISKCRIVSAGLQPKFVASIPQSYTLVKPQRLEENRQLSLWNREVLSILKGKECTVLFANVTGYNALKDKIYAICAVRLKDGRPIEKFFTFVLPEIELTEEQLRNANVTEKQLSLSPTLTEIIPDLFKFLGSNTLIGENLSQLAELLNYYGAPLGFNFSNKTVTPAAVFQRMFEHSDIDVRPSFSQLGEVAKILKVGYIESQSSNSIATTVAECISALVDHAR